MRSYTFKLKNNIPILIREGIQADINQVWELFNLVVRERKYLPTIYPIYVAQERASWFYEMQRPRNLLLVALDKERIIGYLTLEEKPDDASKHVCTLGVLIHPYYRKQGLGAKLIELAIKQAKNREYEKIVLSVFHTNEAAIQLYKNAGFKVVGRMKKQFKLNDEYIDEILMEHYLFH
ncbi:MAG: GNAT family N-acetyltransferase [Candidatus Ranarchaeia archaeon]